MKYDLKAIMTHAWTLVRNGAKTMASALKQAWFEAKTPLRYVDEIVRETEKAVMVECHVEGRAVGVWFPKSVVTLQNRAVYAPMAWILRKGREAAASRNAFEAYFFAANLRVA